MNTKQNSFLCLVDTKKYISQLGTVHTALQEWEIHSPESFEQFVNRMFELGVIGITPCDKKRGE